MSKLTLHLIRIDVGLTALGVTSSGGIPGTSCKV